MGMAAAPRVRPASGTFHSTRPAVCGKGEESTLAGTAGRDADAVTQRNGRVVDRVFQPLTPLELTAVEVDADDPGAAGPNGRRWPPRPFHPQPPGPGGIVTGRKTAKRLRR